MLSMKKLSYGLQVDTLSVRDGQKSHLSLDRLENTTQINIYKKSLSTQVQLSNLLIYASVKVNYKLLIETKILLF